MGAAARAAEPIAGTQESVFNLSLESPRPENPEFWQRFDFAFDDNANDIFSDALDPLNAVRWNMDAPGRDFSDKFRARASLGARHAFAKSIEYGSREAVVELPLLLWFENHQGWFADLVRGSVGDVEEEAISPLNISYGGVAESWWKTLATRGTEFGIRPLSTSPYAFVSHAFSDGEQTLLLMNLRYYYERFSDHRIELAMSIPIAYGVAMNFGSSYQFGAHDHERCAVKFIKEFRGGGVAHLGFEVKGHPRLIAGISFGW